MANLVLLKATNLVFDIWHISFYYWGKIRKKFLGFNAPTIIYDLKFEVHKKKTEI